MARNLSRGLHPITLANEGLPAALAELAERVPKEVQFKWPKDLRLDLDPAVALHVYRIAEEAVGNAIRHSDATLDCDYVAGAATPESVADDLR